MNLLVTGFGPFGKFESNPSRVLAEGCGQPFQILEVSYRFVQEWVERLDPSSFDKLLLMGVNGGGDKMHLERYGHNRTARIPDVRGYTPSERKIHVDGPWRILSSLWTGELAKASFHRRHPEFAHSGSAGGYLCNYVLYQALLRFPEKEVGFLHVPPFEKLPEQRQRELLRLLLTKLGAVN